MAKDLLFFIALLPDEEIRREVTAFKNDCARKFGTSHALKSPPHITLVPPFRWREEQLEALKDTLDLFALGQEPFEVQLRHFNCFKPRVIYVDVVQNEPLALLQRTLQAKLTTSLGLPTRQNRRFHPHMTIAHRDLTAQVFPAAWKCFSQKKYERSFLAAGVALLRHSEGRWHIGKEYFFD